MDQTVKSYENETVAAEKALMKIKVLDEKNLSKDLYQILVIYERKNDVL